MLKEVIFALWFFVPAALANMAPVLVAHTRGLRELDAPLDFGKSWKGKRIFGAHKTWRGLISGIAVAICVVTLQQFAVKHFGWFAGEAAATKYLQQDMFLLGTALGIGTLGGDAVKSFIKRRKNIPSGSVWQPYDLIDHIIGAEIFALPFVIFDWQIYPVVVAVWFLGNLIVSYIGYLLKLKERPI